MDKIKVDVYPDDKCVDAYAYAPTVILIYPHKVWNRDESVVTNATGCRFKRKITGEENPLFFQYHRI